MPKFSIIIPCYKQAHFLGEALESVCNQTFSDWEVIVVDDGSPDNTVEVANEWIARDNRIRLISQPNSGLSAARNRGINAALGKYITLLDADDKYGPIFLQSVYINLEQGFELIVTGYTYFNTSGSIHREVTLSAYLNFRDILSNNLFPPVSVAFKKEVLFKTKYFDTTLKSAEDWDLWIRMYRCGISLAVIPDSLVYYRISENSMSRQPFTMYNAMKEVANRACSLDRRLDKDIEVDMNAVKSLNGTIKKILMMCMGVAVMQGKISEAIRLILQEKDKNSLEINPQDFTDMCSYLSFRYRVSNEDLNWIQDEMMPVFAQFFNQFQLPGLDKEKSYAHVFRIHRQLINRKKWGFLSTIMNQFS